MTVGIDDWIRSGFGSDSKAGAVPEPPDAIPRPGGHHPGFIWCDSWREHLGCRRPPTGVEWIDRKETTVADLGGEWNATDHERRGGRNVGKQAVFGLRVDRLGERRNQPAVGPHEPATRPLEALSIARRQLESRFDCPHPDVERSAIRDSLLDRLQIEREDLIRLISTTHRSRGTTRDV